MNKGNDSNEKDTSTGPQAGTEFSYFGLQSTWGVTKHMGGIEATDELAVLCHIGSRCKVLEVGCGTGVSACHLAGRYGSSLTGVDLSERMIEWAEKRAKRKGLESLVQFRNADGRELPFEDGCFDAVICESVTAFASDKQQAVCEYARVVKKDGYIGLNEGTWIKPPSTGLVEYIVRSTGGARFLEEGEWRKLLEGAALTAITVNTHRMGALSQFLDEMKGLDLQDRIDRIRGIKDFIGLYLHNPAFREYAKQITPKRGVMRSFFDHLGYGLYVGRKP